MGQARLGEQRVVQGGRARRRDGLPEEVEGLGLQLADERLGPPYLGGRQLPGRRLGRQRRVRHGRHEAVEDPAQLAGRAHVQRDDGLVVGRQQLGPEAVEGKVVGDVAGDAHELDHVAVLQRLVVEGDPGAVLPRQLALGVVVRRDDAGEALRLGHGLEHVVRHGHLEVQVLDAGAQADAVQLVGQLVVVVGELAALAGGAHRVDDGYLGRRPEEGDLAGDEVGLVALQQVDAQLDRVGPHDHLGDDVQRGGNVGDGQRDEEGVPLGADVLQVRRAAADDGEEAAKVGRRLVQRVGAVQVGAVVLEVAALVEPRLAAVVDLPDVLAVGRARLVPHQVLDHLVRVAVDQEDVAAALLVGDEQLAGLLRLDDAAAAREDVARGPVLDHVLEELELGLSEALPAPLAADDVGDGHALPPLELLVQVHQRPLQDLRHPPAGRGLAGAAHADHEDGPARARAGRGPGGAPRRRRRRVLLALEVHLEGLRHDVPPARPRLGGALALEDQDRVRRDGRQHAEAHGDAVVVVAVDALGRVLELPVRAARHLDAVLELVAAHAKLGELVLHGRDAVALLDALVRDARDLRGALGDGGEHRGGQEGVRHGLHVDVRDRLERADGRARDGGGRVGLLDGAAHGAEHLDGEAGVALQRLGADVGDGARGARDGGDGERVRGRAGVALDHVVGRVLVDALGDVVRVGVLGRPLDRDAEGRHHGDGHVDVGLRDGLAADEAERHGLVGVGGGHQDGRDVLRRDGGGELDDAAGEAGHGVHAHGQALLLLEVLDGHAVGPQGVDEGPDRPHLHARVARQHGGRGRRRRRAEGGDGREEARRGAGVAEVERLLAGLQLAAAARDDQHLAGVLPGVGGAAQLGDGRQHVLRVVRVQQAVDARGALAEGGQDEGAVRDALGAGRGHADREAGGHARGDADRGRQHDADGAVLDDAGARLVRLADGGQQHDLLVAALVLLVDGHLLEQQVDGALLAGRQPGDAPVVQRGGQVVARDALGQAGDGAGAEHAEEAGELGLAHHADGDALAVQDLRGEDGLVGVADGVAKVEQVAQAALALVRRHDLGLDAGGADHDALEHVADGGEAGRRVRGAGADGVEDGGRVLLEGGELGLVPDGGRLDHLGHAVDELAHGQRLEEGEVDVDAAGLPEGADQVLAHGRVDGRLAADGRVDHGEQGGGHLDEADAAHEGGGDVADHVADDAAAEGDDDRVAGAGVGEHPVLDLGLGLAALGELAGRDGVGEQAGIAGGGAVEDGLEGRHVEREEVGVGDEHVRGRRQVLEEVVSHEAQPEAVVDDDVVAAEDGDARGTAAVGGAAGARHGLRQRVCGGAMGGGMRLEGRGEKGCCGEGGWVEGICELGELGEGVLWGGGGGGGGAGGAGGNLVVTV